MGKKKGQQQRVKGNVLPSSSVRSADLLAKESINAGLGLFQSLPSMALGSLPELAGLDSISNTEFRAVLKKLYKRDVTTKLKGLNEFCILCESAKQHDVLEMLPYWPRIYNRLFEDSERRVRENAQKSMHALVSAAGKNLALQLKNVMGCWFVSQCDLYSPAALSAETGINQAFSGDKKLNAFVFCREDILTCISSYILAPQAKKDRCREDEGNNIYRMVAACLDALSLYIQTVAKHKPVEGEIEVFLDNSSFWKFQKHTSPSVKAGFYSVLESVCIVYPKLANAHSPELCRSIFHRLDENNIHVCKALYAAAVAAAVKCDSWFNQIDIQKGLLAGFRNMLKMGCYGLGGYVLPTILPIFATLPFDSDIMNLFTKLFEAFRLCIFHDQVIQSKRSMELAIASYMEIVKLSVKRLSENTNDMEMLRPFCNSIITDEIIHILRASWSSNRLLRYSVLDIIPSVIQTWESQVCDGDLIYSILSKMFWTELATVIQAECFVPENMAATDRIAVFLYRLGSEDKKSGTRRSVNFGGTTSQKSYLPEQGGKKEAVESHSSNEQIRVTLNTLILECKLLFPLKTEKEMLRLQKNMYEKLGNINVFSQLSGLSDTGTEERQDAIDKVKFFLNSSLVSEILERAEKFNSDNEVSAVLSGILSSVIMHCQKGTEFPCELSPFACHDKPMFMTVLLQLVSDLMANICSKSGPWLYSLINSNSSFNASLILKSVSSSATRCYCFTALPDDINFFDVARSWDILQSILSLSYQNESDIDNYICHPDLRHRVISDLSVMVGELNGCSTCYEAAVKRFANIMMTLLNKNLGKIGRSNDSENIWKRLMDDLFKLYFIARDQMSILGYFDTLFSHFCRGSLSSDFATLLNSYGCRISQRMIVQDEPDKFAKLVEDTSLILSGILQSLHDCDTILAFLETILPSSSDWDRIRQYDISAVKVDFTNDSILLPDQMKQNTDLIDAFNKMLVAIIPDVTAVCEEFNWRRCTSYLRLLEECVLSGTISNRCALLGAFDDVTYDIKKAVLSRIVQKSLSIGGLWAYALKAIAFKDDYAEIIFSQFASSFKRSQITSPLFQTIVTVLDDLAVVKLQQLLHSITERLGTCDSGTVLVSDVYAFAFSLNAACSNAMKQDVDIVHSLHEMVLKWKSMNVYDFLNEEGDIFKDETVVLKNSLGKFYSHLISHFPESVSEDDWDFVQCAILAWIESVAKYSWENGTGVGSVLELAHGSFKMLRVVNEFMLSSTAMDDPTMPSNLTSEWNGFFSGSINSALVRIYISFISAPVSSPLLEELCGCLKYASAESILASASELKPRLTANSDLSDDVQTLINHLCLSFSVSMNAQSDRQRYLLVMSSYELIVKLLDKLSTQETNCPPDEIFHVVRKIFTEVAGSFNVEEVELPKSSAAVSGDSDLEDSGDEDYPEINLTDTLAVTIESNAVTVLLYLLLWRILIKLTRFINPDRKSEYVNSIMKQNNPNISDDLLPHLFKLMVGKKMHFRDSPNIHNEGSLNFEFIQHVSACVYKEFLIEMPAASRAWYNDLPKVIRSRVDKFTSSNVSPVLIDNEFKAIRATASQQNKDGMEISAKPGAREVHASYQLNELKMEIAVCLPPNHPLGPIVVNTEKRAGVVVGQWRYWILQITSFLQYQNGGIIDGLLMWKEKVDKKFEGMEECMICFSLVHGTSQSLPKLKCKTCKKKYHPQCLYKWFDTSNNSTCPLCRSPMIFR